MIFNYLTLIGDIILKQGSIFLLAHFVRAYVTTTVSLEYGQLTQHLEQTPLPGSSCQKIACIILCHYVLLPLCGTVGHNV